MKPLRLIADDLTGALDTAAQFVGAGRTLPVFLGEAIPSPAPRELAVDAATREMDSRLAVASATRLAPLLSPGFSAIAYKKVDSLLRGHPGLELAATLRVVLPRYCIIAPAFPLHGRVTRGGRQFTHSAGAPAGKDLRATLRSQGFAVTLRRADDPVPEGVSLWDAESDADLRSIADAGAALGGGVLWCGSGGLAAAIANARVPGQPGLRRPMLGLFGSDHPVTAAQMERCVGHLVRIREGEPDSARVAERLKGPGICMVSCELPHGVARKEASLRIALEFERLAGRIPKPKSLIVAGGQTLRALCRSLGTDHLEVVGQVTPGVPVSRLVGGRWDGTLLVSKSGSFGDDALLLGIISLTI